jgi:GPH family glycoside/pentoside/hexuronide:cation symporter
MEIEDMEKIGIELEEPKHSKLSMASFGFGKFINEFYVMAFGALVFFFYERALGLNSILTMGGYIIFALWNAVNDPLIGHLTDRPFKFTKKWGRRFPWVYVGGIPWIASYILIFAPPIIYPSFSYGPFAISGQWILFTWLIFSTCLYDTFASIFNVSFYSIFPDKFRTGRERRNASTISTQIAAIGTACGAILPPLFYTYGLPRTYIIQAIVATVACMIALVLSIPGTREDRVRIDCYLEKCEEGMERSSFFKEFGRILKHRNFMAYIITFTFYQSLVSLMTGSIPYVTEFVLFRSEADITIIMAILLVGMIVSMPLWSFVAHKTNNDRKTMLIASVFLTVVTFVLFFVRDFNMMMIAIFIWGFGEGGFWVMMSPIFANAIDESVIETGERREGIYNGIQTFVGRAALVVQAVTIGLVHIFTNFNPDNMTSLARTGIQIHFALIPAILMAIGALIFGLYYKLTPDKVELNRGRLIELKI